jgi:hypothetical protein
MENVKEGERIRFEYKGELYYGIAEGTVFAGRWLVRMRPNAVGTPNLIPLNDCTHVAPEETPA